MAKNIGKSSDIKIKKIKLNSNQSALTKIKILENSITSRRSREAQFSPNMNVGGGHTALTWIQDVMSKIDTLRKSLT